MKGAVIFMDEDKVKIEIMPMLVLRGITAFPNMTMNFEVERPMSVSALDKALNSDRKIFLVSQKDPRVEEPKEEDIYTIGTICMIKQVLRLPQNGLRIMVEGVCRAKLLAIITDKKHFIGELKLLEAEAEAKLSSRAEVMLRHSYELYSRYLELTSSATPEAIVPLTLGGDAGYVADYITQNIRLRHTEKQKMLEELSPAKRIEKVNKILQRELEILEVEEEIKRKTQERLIQSQKDNILREQMKTIKSELGEGADDGLELDVYRQKIENLTAPKQVTEKLMKELGRLSKQPFGSAESSVIRGYLDTCLELPWSKTTKEEANVEAARKLLDAEHFGLPKVKERILEFIAVKQLAPDIKGTILCLVGPPGTGKTSVAMSVAKALNRKLVRVSLGGIHDEAEIRGHRKTYVGAMPGRIIAAMLQAGTKNPLILLDEIDKLGSDHRGDPSAALLEALDVEQNMNFRDHYLELPYDLSDVMFITTANTTETISRPLLDRMELIELTSYTDEEKLQIAKRHLFPKQRKKHGIKANQLKVSDDAFREIISRYTRESGVRILERELAELCRKAAVKLVGNEAKSFNINASKLEDFLGVPKYKPEARTAKSEVGLAHGLAWTSVGGEVLNVEATVLDGNGKLELTGNLGDVMKESARAAESYIRSRASELGVDPEFYKNKDIHVHFPEGAVPKDGPSAGITIAITLISALTGRPVRRDVAMTGEITLRGRILPIGGLKEKTMAAYRYGIKTVIIPLENEPDLKEIDQTVKNSLNIIAADHIDSLLDLVLEENHKVEHLATESVEISSNSSSDIKGSVQVSF